MKKNDLKKILEQIVTEELNEWDEPGRDFGGDGYTNDYQRAFAHSQATTPRKNETNKAIELAKRGKYVLMVTYPIHCKTTDACLGSEIAIHKVFSNREEAEKEAEKLHGDGNHDEDFSIIGPENVDQSTGKLKQKKIEPLSKTPEDDIPFQESKLKEINHTIDSSGKSIVSQGAPGSVVRFATENPEIIKTMRDWISDCSWLDLDGSEVDSLSDEEVLRGVQKHFDGGIKEFIRTCNSTAQVPVGYKEGYGMGDMSKDPKRAFKGARWTVKYNESKISISEVKNIIKELISEAFGEDDIGIGGSDDNMDNSNDSGTTLKRATGRLTEPGEDEELVSLYKGSKPESTAGLPSVGGAMSETMEKPDDWNPQSIPKNVDDISKIIHSLPEGTGVFFSYDKETGHSSDWIWIECVSDGESFTYYMTSNGGGKVELEDDSMIDDIASEVLNGGYNYYAIQKINGYEKPSYNSFHPEDDQEIGDYERYGADQPEPQYEAFKKLKSIVREALKEEFNKVQHTISNPVKDSSTGEWIIKWMTNGKRDENKTYYTNDKQDAINTAIKMRKQAEEMNGLQKENGGIDKFTKMVRRQERSVGV